MLYEVITLHIDAVFFHLVADLACGHTEGPGRFGLYAPMLDEGLEDRLFLLV